MSLPAPTRRALIGATVWSVPAISVASAAPAFAASSCVPAIWEFRFTADNWEAAASPAAPFYRQMVGQATPLRPAVGEGVLIDESVTVDAITLTAGAVSVGASRPWNLNEPGNVLHNMEVTQATGGVGGSGNQGLGLLQEYPGVTGVTAGDYQEITFTFSREVTDLSFNICDVDNSGSQYVDLVSIVPAPTSAVLATGLEGAGTTSLPWRTSASAPTQQVGNTTGLRNVKVTYAAATSVTIRFWNGVTSGLTGRGQHGIFINDISFKANTCA